MLKIMHKTNSYTKTLAKLFTSGTHSHLLHLYPTTGTFKCLIHAV